MNGLGTPGPTGGRRGRGGTDGGLAAGRVGSDRDEGVRSRALEGVVRGRSRGEQGKTVKVVCKLDRADARRKCEFTAKLDGLPPRAVAQPVEREAGDDGGRVRRW